MLFQYHAQKKQHTSKDEGQTSIHNNSINWHRGSDVGMEVEMSELSPRHEEAGGNCALSWLHNM